MSSWGLASASQIICNRSLVKAPDTFASAGAESTSIVLVHEKGRPKAALSNEW